MFKQISLLYRRFIGIYIVSHKAIMGWLALTSQETPIDHVYFAPKLRALPVTWWVEDGQLYLQTACTQIPQFILFCKRFGIKVGYGHRLHLSNEAGNPSGNGWFSDNVLYTTLNALPELTHSVPTVQLNPVRTSKEIKFPYAANGVLVVTKADTVLMPDLSGLMKHYLPELF